eukprot:98343_1
MMKVFYFQSNMVVMYLFIRGKCGYSFNGELEELKRMHDSNDVIRVRKIEFKKRQYNVQCDITKEFLIGHINSLRDDINISSGNIISPQRGWSRSRMTVQLKNVSLNLSLDEIDVLEKNIQKDLNSRFGGKDYNDNYSYNSWESKCC